MFQQQKENERGGLKLCGRRVCQLSFRLLLGIGRYRAGRIRRAVLKGEEDCPVDERFQPRKNLHMQDTSVRPQVAEFLQKMYNQLAEPLPEARSRQDGLDSDLLPSIKKRGRRPRHLYKLDDDTKAYRDGVKFLPPGSVVDYWDLCKEEFPHLKIGRKVFCRAAWQAKLFVVVL